MKAFKEFLASKAKEKKEPMDPKALKAKKEMLNHLSGMMKDHMSEGLKKVTVASDSEEGLKKGLEKAEEIIEKKEMPSMEESEEMSDDDSEEEMSEDEIEQMIQMLQAKKEALKK